MTPEQTLGYRLNNWVNIRSSPDNWNGLMRPGRGGAFAEFSAPVFSLRAGVITFRNYPRFHPTVNPWAATNFPGATPRSVVQLISTWAPEADHNNTLRYILHMREWGGFLPLAEPNLFDEPTASHWISCIVREEIGGPPKDFPAVLRDAMRMLFPQGAKK